LDLLHVAVGQRGRHQAHHLAVLGRRLRVHELQRVGVHEAVVVVEVQRVQPPAERRPAQGHLRILGPAAAAVIPVIPCATEPTTAPRDFHDGRRDGLVPLESLDLSEVRSFSGLLRAMSRTAFGGRSLGEAFEVVLAMARDPDCKVVLTLSGAMTIAKMGKVIATMIDHGLVQAIVSPGALMAHGLSEAVGMVHYRYDPGVPDEELFEKGYNRVYDTLEMESNLNYVEEFST